MEDRGVGHAVSGHLELDESGNVITDTTDLPSDHTGSATALLGGPDVPTWTERLAEAGVARFLRRHGAVLASVLAIAVAGTAFYVGTRPPPDDGVVAVTIEPAPTGDGRDGGVVSDDGVMTMGYRLTPTRSTDTLRAIGLVGPAVRRSSVHTRTEAAPGLPVLVDVSAVPGCDNPRSATASLAAYRLRVERTDSFGRTAIGVVPLVSQYEDLLDQFVHPCTQALLRNGLRAESVRTAVDPARRTVHLTVVVRSSLLTDVTLQPYDVTADPSSPVAVVPDDLGALIPSGGTATVRAGLVVRDCSSPELPDAVETDPFTGTTAAPRPGLLLQATVPLLGRDWSRDGDVTLAWPDRTQATIQAALDRLCEG